MPAGTTPTAHAFIEPRHRQTGRGEHHDPPTPGLRDSGRPPPDGIPQPAEGIPAPDLEL